ncbi:MAG: sodium:proton antiporter [Fusobacteria bacterium]|nr:sodium:proton antiporter [Fusobacteriota bacterium]
MILNLSIIILIVFIISHVFEKIKIPKLVGIIFLGILIGPYTKEIFINNGVMIKNGFIANHVFITDYIMEISSDLKNIALIIILLRAGLSISKDILKKIGNNAIKLSVIPGVIEGIFVMILTFFIFKISLYEAGMLGFILGAVSPAVIVPLMIELKNRDYGKKNELPTLILTGASLDDIVAITIFTVFLNLSIGSDTELYMQIINIPIKIIIGIIIGVVIGKFYCGFFKKLRGIRDTKKMIILIIIAILLCELEKYIPIAIYIAIMIIGFVIKNSYNELANRLESKLNKVWILAEIMLFLLVGASINLNSINGYLLLGACIIIFGLIGRGIGVLISLYNSNLNREEKLFCIVSYIPKATVQAAMCTIPLAMGAKNGEIIIGIAVLSILITAPLGAIGIRFISKKYKL